MGYLGNVRPTIALVADDITDGAVTTAKIADDAVTGAKVGEALSHRNVIINGAMQVAQRGTSITGYVGNTAYDKWPDRWHIYLSSCGTYTVSQSTTAPSDQGFTNSLKIDCTTADASPASGDQFYLRQLIEAQYLQHLKYGTANAETMTLSFWVRCNKTGNATVSLNAHDTSRNFSQTYTINSANTWEQKTLTFAGDTSGVMNNDTGRGIDVRWWLDSGSNFTGGTQAAGWEGSVNANRNTQNLGLASSTSNEFYVTGVQLEVGTATPYEHRSYSEELYRCLRYLWVTGVTQDKVFFHGHVADNDTFRCHVQFPVDMRATPTIVSTTGAWRVANASLNTSYSNAWTFGGDYKGGQVTMSDSGGTDMASHQKPGYTHPHVSGTSIRFDAEL